MTKGWAQLWTIGLWYLWDIEVERLHRIKVLLFLILTGAYFLH